MKTILTILLSFLMGSAFAASDTLKIQTSAECGACKERIENKLNFTKGVKSAVLDLDTKIVIVIYDKEKVSADEIRKAINKTGYDADSTAADPKAYHKLPKCCQKGGMSGK